MGNAWALYSDPEGTPHPLQGPSFDPLYGFPNGRKERGKWIMFPANLCLCSLNCGSNKFSSKFSVMIMISPCRQQCRCCFYIIDVLRIII
jgi:hypothetical protein